MRWIQLIRLRSALASFRRDRSGGVALLSAMLVLPLIIGLALAVDFSFYIFDRAQINLAADAAAVHAVRLASQLYNSGSTSFADAETAGIQAGQQWFAAQLGRTDATAITTQNIAVTVSYLPSPGGFEANVTYTGTVNNKLGAFITPSWPIATNATAQFTNGYLEIVLMLDNSSSMLIGATGNDMKRLMQITPCYSGNATYPGQKTSTLNVAAYSDYACSNGGVSYPASATPPCPVPMVPPYIYSTMPVQATAPSCQGLLPKVRGQYPTAGPPCAFACHQDTSAPAGQGNDFYALARSTINTPNQITLRFDLLKQATNLMLGDMATSAAVAGNLTVGIYTFASALGRVYPSSGEAGSNFTTAIAAVGAPPTAPNQPDTGIQPDAFVATGPHSDTNFPAAMDSLAQIVTASGDGNTAATPTKTLVIITDGLEDFNSNTTIAGLDITRCNTFKNMGYTVYVVYTQYYPLMWADYYTHEAAIVEGTGPGSVTYNLQQCASSTSNFIAASDLKSLTAALQSILVSAQLAATHVVK